MNSPAERDDALAAEYVLGVLPGPEREQVAARIADDEQFARLVAAWETTLAPLAGDVEPVLPPDRVWSDLENALFEPSAAQTSGSGWWSSLALWRGLAFGAVLLAVGSLIYPQVADRGTDDGSRLTATLQSDETADKFVAGYDRGSHELVLTALNQVPEPGRDYELWLIEGDAAPVSLGVVPGGQSARVAVPEPLRAKLVAGNLLAVSLEPQGGSTTGAPTGPVVAAGKISRL
ncbi:MAG: anti-sigma factor [Anderseniella sp.]